MFDRFKRGGGGDGAVSAGDAARERDRAYRTTDRTATGDTGERDLDTTTVRDRGDELSARGAEGRDAGATEAGTTDESRFARDETSGDRGDRGHGRVGAAATGAAGERLHERHREREAERASADEPVERRAPVASRERAASGPLVRGETMAAVRERQRDRFGGFSWGSDFFGFLCALGLASILAGIATAAGAAFNVFDNATSSSADAKSVGLGSGIALLVILAIAWFAGGYVAGRMARFDGGRQGVGVWLWTILIIAAVAILAAIGGSKYNVFSQLNLPSIPVSGDTLTGAGAVTGVLALLVTLLFAVLGGKVGERFHRKVDRVAHDEDYAYAR